MSRALLGRYWAGQDPYDPVALATMRHPAWSADWPQSAERIASHDADVAIHTSHPAYPAHRLERLAGSDEVWRPLPTSFMSTPFRISGASDIWIVEARLEYPDDGIWHAIVSAELRDGLIGHETAYYCRASLPAAWPTYPAQAPVSLPAVSASMEHDASAERRHHAAFRSYVDTMATDPSSAVHALYHDHAVIDRPQDEARVSGLADIARVHDGLRSLLPGRVRRVIATGDVLLTESQVSPAGTTWFLVRILEFDGDRVARATEYLAESYEPPDWRKAWIEPLPVDG
jgi:hypothetical protein